MNNNNKIKPEEIKGTIPLPSRSPIKVDKDAIENNKSTKTSEEYIKELKKAAKENLFTPSPSEEIEEEDGKY